MDGLNCWTNGKINAAAFLTRKMMYISVKSYKKRKNGLEPFSIVLDIKKMFNGCV